MLTRGAFELTGVGQIVDELGNGDDLVGLLRHAALRQHQSGGGSVGAERMQGLGALALIVRAPRGLAVDGDEVGTVRPHLGHPALEATLEQDRIDPVEQDAQPALAGDAVVEGREAAQELQVMPAPGGDVVEVVAGGDGAADHQQQDLAQRIHHPPGLARVLELGKVLQQQRQAISRRFLEDRDSGHLRSPSESPRQGITSRRATQTTPLTRVPSRDGSRTAG